MTGILKVPKVPEVPGDEKKEKEPKPVYRFGEKAVVPEHLFEAPH